MNISKKFLLLSAVCWTISGTVIFYQQVDAPIWHTVIFSIACAIVGAYLCRIAWPEDDHSQAVYLTPDQIERRRQRKEDDDEYIRGIGS